MRVHALSNGALIEHATLVLRKQIYILICLTVIYTLFFQTTDTYYHFVLYILQV